MQTDRDSCMQGAWGLFQLCISMILFVKGTCIIFPLVTANPSVPPSDACIVDVDNGKCDDYVLKWYFEKKLHICTQFWYGGCGGNANRFETREECEALCIKSS